MTEREKVLIGVPGYNGIVPEAMQSFLGMIFRCGRDLPEYDVAVEIVVKKEQFRARNAIVEAAIGSGCKWLLMLDDDMVVPPDLVKRLIAHDKDVCGALYFQRGGAYHPVLLNRVDMEDGRMATRFIGNMDERLTDPGLHKVDIIGGGCMLFKVDVFRKILPPYFEWERTLGTDIAICSRLADAGVEIWCDTSMEIGHIREEKQVVTSRTIPLAKREMGQVSQELWEDAIEYLGTNAAELEEQLVRQSQREVRKQAWKESVGDAGDTWEGVKKYYQDHGDWHAINLLNFNLKHPERTKEYALTQLPQILTGKQAHILDVGPGIGHMSIPLAMRHGHQVHCVEVEKAATLDFLRWRIRHHNLTPYKQHHGIRIYEMKYPAPHDRPSVLCDAALMISRLEHTFDPLGLLNWVATCLKPGGLLICDYEIGKCGDDEPQHIMRYDPTVLASRIQHFGLFQSPEHPWLFTKR